MEKQNIIFVIKPDKDRPRTFIAYPNNLKHDLERFGMGYMNNGTINQIVELAKNDKFGKHDVEGCVVYVLPDSMTKLYNHQYPLIVIREEEVIDIDEWWYTPFKHLMAERKDQNCEYSSDLDTWKKDDYLLGMVDNGYLVRFKVNPEDNNHLHVVKTVNVSFK